MGTGPGWGCQRLILAGLVKKEIRTRTTISTGRGWKMSSLNWTWNMDQAQDCALERIPTNVPPILLSNNHRCCNLVKWHKGSGVVWRKIQGGRKGYHSDKMELGWILLHRLILKVIIIIIGWWQISRVRSGVFNRGRGLDNGRVYRSVAVGV